MCFNAEISLATYLIGTIGSLKLWTAGFKPESLFYLWVVQMQLIEFLLWLTIDPQDNERCLSPFMSVFNSRISQLGVIINHLEP